MQVGSRLPRIFAAQVSLLSPLSPPTIVWQPEFWVHTVCATLVPEFYLTTYEGGWHQRKTPLALGLGKAEVEQVEHIYSLRDRFNCLTCNVCGENEGAAIQCVGGAGGE
jgi:hypothetical protein